MLIAFEGVDGSGKTTQAKMLAEYLKVNDIPVWSTYEPYNPEIRKLLLSENDYTPTVEALLFAADRAYHQVDILEHLHKGEIVITDRYIGSSIAYQGGDILNNLIRDTFDKSRCANAHVTIWVDTPIQICQDRIKARQEANHFDGRNLYSIKQSYENQWRTEKNWYRVDGSKTLHSIAEEISTIVRYQIDDRKRRDKYVVR